MNKKADIEVLVRYIPWIILFMIGLIALYFMLGRLTG